MEPMESAIVGGLAESILGRNVHIKWEGEQGESVVFAETVWHRFQVGSLDARLGWIQLRGIDEPDVGKHDGNSFWCSLESISTIEVLEASE